MDAYEATRIVFSRIQAVDSENAAKIMGLLLIQDHGEKEMIRLAFGPETLLHSVVIKARKELGLHAASSPSSAPITPSPFHHHPLSRQSSSRFGMAPPPPPLTITSPSWAPPIDAHCSSDDLMSPIQSPAAACSPFYGNGNNNGTASADFAAAADDFPIQDQLSFLNDPYQEMGWAHHSGPHHRRSYSAAPDLCISPDASGFGWKPCLYFARGFCKNGSSCRFLHGLPDDGGKLDAAIEQQCHELLLRSKSPRLAHAAFPFSPTAPIPISPSSSKCMNYLFQQQQNESQRAAAATAAAALMLGGDESHKFMGRSRMDRADFAGMVNPVSRQIYLTFPADSTFREEDVSNYFSIYGPVQDVRIPYQQKRMFGFVTFVYPETVKLILAKGNPHFVCDARVLVKPYKEKGKVPDKKQQQMERGDFSGCSSTTPSGLDSRDPYDLQQLGARLLYNNSSSSSSSQEMLLRRKLEEQQQAAELQQAIEMQGRRFMGLQLLDFNNRGLQSSSSSSTTISSPATITAAPASNDRSHEESPTREKSPSPASCAAEELQQVKAVNCAAAAAIEKEESAARDGSPNEDSDFQESLKHNLPDSPFASPTKASSLLAEDPFAGPATSAIEADSFAGSALRNGSGNNLIASTILPPTSTLDMASFKSCFFQIPRFSSGHGAVGL